MTKQRWYCGINGIMNWPGSRKGCTDLIADYIMNHTKYQCDKMEYACGPLLSKEFFQSGRVEILREKSSKIPCGVYLIGHSNGADIIQKYINSSYRRIEQIHLVAGACESDFRRSGLNKALITGRLGEVHVYFSKNDNILRGRKESFFNAACRKIGLGYGWLGYSGPKYVDALVESRVIRHEWECGHSEYFDKDNLPKLMQQIIG